MWTAIMAALKSFFSVCDQLLSVFREAQLREAGRNEVRLEQAQKALKDMEKSREIDARPTPADPRDVLKRL